MSAATSLRALVIDDDEFMLDLVEDFLSLAGVSSVGRALDGDAALAALDGAEQPWDLVFCDLKLPGIDGIQLARQLARRQFSGGVALMTGRDRRLAETVGQLVRQHGLHFVGALCKPFDAVAVRGVLAELASLRATSRRQGPSELLSMEEVRSGLRSAACVEVFLQPKVSVATGQVVGGECLARWRDPVRGLLPPSAFVPVAEEHGLISELTQQVIAQAIGHLGRWAARGHRMSLAVNLSPEDLVDIDMPDQVAAVAAAAGLEPGQFTFELTETRLVRDLGTALEILTRLRLKGFGLSIDDFGTGYSNLGTLRLLPFNELKVDRSFVHGAGSDLAARAILESSIRLARALDMTVVAEGAETREELDLLRELGCDLVQGYYIARPLPAEEFLAWVGSREASRVG